MITMVMMMKDDLLIDKRQVGGWDLMMVMMMKDDLPFNKRQVVGGDLMSYHTFCLVNLLTSVLRLKRYIFQFPKHNKGTLSSF